jgi:4-amino-4-deoxy-L-arabinose transferase-like glycosyltransferase
MTTLALRGRPGSTIRIRPRSAAFAVLCLIVAAAALRIPTLGEQSYWFDEGRTIRVIHASFTGMLHNDYTGETTPELYYILAWAWAQIAGYGEFAIRLLSAVAGILTVPVAFLIGRKLSSARAGVIAAALTAFNPMLIWYSQEARCYSLMVLLSSLGLLAFVLLLDEPTPRWLGIWALVSGLALTTHYYTALSVVPEGIWLLWRHRRQRPVWLAIGVVAIWGLALVPQEMHQARLVPGGGWISTIPLGTRLPIVFVEQLLGPSRIFTPFTLGIDVVVAGFAALAIARRRELLRASAPALAITAAGAAIFALSILSGHDLLDPRNVLAIWMPLTVTLSIGLASYRSPRRRNVAVLAVCIVGVVTVIAVDTNTRLQRPAWSSVAQQIQQRPVQAVFDAYGCQIVPLTLYIPVRPVTGTLMVTSLEVITTEPQLTLYDVLMKNWYADCAQFGTPIRLPAELAGFTRSGVAKHFGQFTIQRYSSPTPRPVSTTILTQTGLSGSGLLMSVKGKRPLV